MQKNSQLTDPGSSHATRSQKAGLPPESLVYTGYHKKEPSLVYLDFDQTEFKPLEAAGDTWKQELPGDKRYWLHLTGLSNVALVGDIGRFHNVHNLLLEDILNTDSLPKVDDYGEVIAINLKLLDWAGNRIETDHVSMVIGRKFLLTFQEKETKIFDTLKERLTNGAISLQERNPDFLAYLLIDKIVDNYYLIVDKLEDEYERLEIKLIRNDEEVTPQQIIYLKKQLILLRKYLYPLLDELRKSLRVESDLLQRNTLKYTKDVMDHLQNMLQQLEAFRDNTSNLMDLHAANNSLRMNQIMKTLTIVGAIFIPLTFIVGVYGMNFRYMPELEQPMGYYTIWGVMIILSVGMLLYMKTRKWF